MWVNTPFGFSLFKADEVGFRGRNAKTVTRCLREDRVDGVLENSVNLLRVLEGMWTLKSATKSMASVGMEEKNIV